MNITLKQWRQDNLSKISSANSQKRLLIREMDFVEHVLGDLVLRSKLNEGEEFLPDECWVRVCEEYELNGVKMPVYLIEANGVELRLKSMFGCWAVYARDSRGGLNPVSTLFAKVLERSANRKPPIDLTGLPAGSLMWSPDVDEETCSVLIYELWDQHQVYALALHLFE